MKPAHPLRNLSAPGPRRRLAMRPLALLPALALVAWTAVGARAQGSGMPGLVVTTPPPAQPSGPAPGAGAPIIASPPSAPPAKASAPKAAAPAKQPPKTKPKPAPTKQASTAPTQTDASTSQGIVALVNDEPITAYEVQERALFLSLTADINDRARANMKGYAQDPKTNERLKAILEETIKANAGKTRDQVIAAFEERKKAFVISLQQQAVANAKASVVPGLKKKSLEELIEERLKLQEAKKLSAITSDDEVEKAFKSMAERNKMTSEQFVAHIKSQGADARTMKARFKATFSWREVIRRRFGHQISVSSREVDRIAAAASAGGQESTELHLQKVTLASAGKLDQGALAQRYAEAEALRQKFAGCKTTAALTKDRPNVKFEDLGYKRASGVTEPTRTLLLNASDGEMVPGTPTGSGIELYAVCGRRTPKIDDQKRQAAENELQQKEFDRLSQRHLNDLRKDALIEIR